MSKQRGITLLALVITIIIMLILAGVTINVMTGDNGLFSRAKQAKKNTVEVQKVENTTIAEYENKIDDIVGSRNESETTKLRSLIDKIDNYTFSTPYNTSMYYTSDNIITLTESIENYDYLFFDIDEYYTTSESYVLENTTMIDTKKIKEMYTKEYGWENGKYLILTNDAGDNHNRISLSFSDSTKIVVWSGRSTSKEMTKLRIRDIRGIKF